MGVIERLTAEVASQKATPLTATTTYACLLDSPVMDGPDAIGAVAGAAVLQGRTFGRV